MTVTITRGWTVILLLDVAVRQHDECLFDRFVYGACIECTSDKPTNPTHRAAIRKMLIRLNQSKWDAGPKTVLGPSRPPATYLRKAKGRVDNMKQ
jgi:hypothetical protein